jgi:hypothetical protein
MKKLALTNKNEILNTYKPSLTLQSVANRVGVSKATVSNILKENNFKIPKKIQIPKKKLSIKKERRIYCKFV